MGNINEIQHQSGSNSFTRNFNYRTGLNQFNTIDDGASPTPTVYTSYTHDASGNQTKLSTERFLEWDYADQLKLFKIDNGTTTKWAQYRYSVGQRVKKVSSVAGRIYTTTVYIDGIFEYQFLKRGGNTYERNYSHIMDDSTGIAQLRTGSSQEDIADSAFYVVDDHLGTSTLRLTGAAALIDRQEIAFDSRSHLKTNKKPEQYYPFGETYRRSFDYKRYQYTGKERDEESGLYYYGARYYSAWTCRFIGVDPLARDYPQLTPYNYASNKSINNLDIDGMQTPGEPKESKKANSQSKSSVNKAVKTSNKSVNGTEKEQKFKTGDKVKEGEGPLAYAMRNGIAGDTNLETLDNLAGMNPEKFKNYDSSWNDSEKTEYWDNLSAENWIIHPDDVLKIGQPQQLKITGGKKEINIVDSKEKYKPTTINPKSANSIHENVTRTFEYIGAGGKLNVKKLLTTDDIPSTGFIGFLHGGSIGANIYKATIEIDLSENEIEEMYEYEVHILPHGQVWNDVDNIMVYLDFKIYEGTRISKNIFTLD